MSQQPPSNGLLWEATVKLRREHSLGARALFHQHSSNSNTGSGSGSNASSMFSPMSAGRQPSHTGGISSNSSGSKAGSGMYPSIPGSPNPAGQPQQQQPAAQQPELPHDAPIGDMHTLEAVFKAGIARPEDLPAVVSAAQACLLNSARPTGEHSKRGMLHTTSFGHAGNGSPGAADAAMGLKTADAAQHAGLKFSRDVVIVEVAGAPVDLTLIDLPGDSWGCTSCCA